MAREGEKTTLSDEVFSDVQTTPALGKQVCSLLSRKSSAVFPPYLPEKTACSLFFLSWKQLPPLRMKPHNSQPLIFYLPFNNLSKVYTQPLQEAEGKSTSFLASWWFTAPLEMWKKKIFLLFNLHFLHIFLKATDPLEVPENISSSPALTATMLYSNIEFAYSSLK